MSRPSNIFFLVLPQGISQGFVTVALPYLLTHRGFSVDATAGIVAVGLSANIWRFLWGPVADLTLSLRKWFWIGVLASIATLMVLCFTPLTVKGLGLLTLIVFISQVAATFIMLPVGGFMAHRIAPEKKGRAGGWFQAGSLGGVGLGGGAGLWLATHYNVALAGIVLCVVSILSALVVWKIEDVKSSKDNHIGVELVSLGKNILAMVRIPVVLFVMILICLPIGSGGASNVWSAIAGDWHVDADTVALITGVLSGLVSMVGSIIGGFIADRWGNWVAYLGCGMVCAFVTAAMALLPLQPLEYIAGVLAYAFGLGMVYAAFSSTLLYATGKKSASTKYALLSSLGNITTVYMTAFDGWAHDKYNSRYMLMVEAVVCTVFVLICMLVLYRMKAKHLLLRVIE